MTSSFTKACNVMDHVDLFLYQDGMVEFRGIKYNQ